jgi:hypothetical protein
MGFRLASLRRTNVVMAPDCTYLIFVKGSFIGYHQVECVVVIGAGNPAMKIISNTAAIVSYMDASEENRKRCLQMERRIERLTRRLKLKQSKLYGLHTSEQISGFLDFCRCKFVDLQRGSHTTHNSHSPPEVAMDVYLKRLKRCSEQSCVPLNNDKFNHYFGFNSKESRNARSCTLSVAPKFDMNVYEHIEKISGELHAQVRTIAHDFDSDVTASSSGCDSLDEETPQPTSEQLEDRIKKIPL